MPHLRRRCRGGHQGLAKLLISSRAELLLDTVSASGMMCEFAKKGDVESVKLLLLAGCDANAADYDKRTAIHLGEYRNGSNPVFAY